MEFKEELLKVLRKELPDHRVEATFNQYKVNDEWQMESILTIKESM